MKQIFHLANIYGDFVNPNELDWGKFERAAVETGSKQWGLIQARAQETPGTSGLSREGDRDKAGPMSPSVPSQKVLPYNTRELNGIFF